MENNLEIFEQTYQQVYVRAKTLLKKEDAIQKLMKDVYVQVFQQKNNFTIDSMMKLLTEAVYTLGCQTFRTKKVREADYIELDKAYYTAGKNIDMDKMKDVVCEALEELPDMHYATLFAFYVDGIRVKEMTKLFGYSEGALLNRLNYTHKYLQKTMEHYQEEDKKAKIAFSAEGIYRVLVQLAQETKMTEAAAQSAYLAICRELEMVSEGNAFTEKEGIPFVENEHQIEALASEFEHYTKRGKFNQKQVKAIVAGIVLLIAVVAGVSIWSTNREPEDLVSDYVPSQDKDNEVQKNEDDKQEDSQTEESEYLLPMSATRELTREDLEGLSKEELRLARNEIFARHGMIFGVEDLDAYFATKSWYTASVPAKEYYDRVDMSLVEEYNLTFIQGIEKEME